ncbi:hypothetical protein RB594_002432 [Gaeumannomyces avenae]
MPFLEELELSNVAVGQQLENLLYNYSKDPRKKALSLRLVNVCADATSAYTWARFFSRLVELRVVIHRFELGDSTKAFKRHGYTRYEVAELFADANALLASNPSLRVFPYVIGFYGVVGDNDTMTAGRLIEGEDQAAYDAFMATVKLAAAAAAAS